MKEYQVLISGILIAVAIYLGLTHTPSDPYEGAFEVPPPDPSLHDTDLEVCMDIATKAKNADGEPILSYGKAFAACVSRGNA